MTDKDKQDESNFSDEIVEAVKKKIGSGYLFFVVLSFIGLNWKDLLLLLKSKKNIEDLIPNLFQSEYIFGFHIWPWVFHFFLPVIFGVAFSIISSYLNLIVTRFTSRANELAIRMGDIVRIKVELKILSLEEGRDEIKGNLERNKKEMERLIRENDVSRDLISKASTRLDDLFLGVESIINLYPEIGKINSVGDFEKFIHALNDSKFGRDESLIDNLNRIIVDLKGIKESY